MPNDSVIPPETVQATSTKAAQGDIELKKELLARYKKSVRFTEKWEECAKEDYRFALGDQWTDEERRILAEQARPALTFNRIRPMINLVSGYQRENSSRIKVNPEGGEDKVFSEVMDRMLRHMDKITKMNYKFGYWFDDGLYCGKGWLEAIIDYDSDPIHGSLKIKQRSPYQIRIDPDCLEYDLNEGCSYLFKEVRLTKSQISELYPGKATLIKGFVKDDDDEIANGAFAEDGGPQSTEDDDYGNDSEARNSQTSKGAAPSADDDESNPTDGKFLVKEYWRPKLVEKWFVVSKDTGLPKKFGTEAAAGVFAGEQGMSFRVIARRVKEMWVSAYACGYILDDKISPFEPEYSGYPFFRYLADWAPNAESEESRIQGMVRALKDPQREKNKAKSQYLHILNTQANSGWVADDDALSLAGFELLEKMGSKPGIVIKKKVGKELREIEAKFPNQGHVQREEKADEEFKQISSINPDLMGFQEGTTSGRAISMRIKQAVLALVRLFYNYRYSKEIVGNFILAMVPRLFDAKKVMKVIGTDYMAKAVEGGLNEGHIDAYLQMVADNKYDVSVVEADANSTVRYEIFQELTELLKAGAPIPIELLIDYMDLPNSQEVKEKVMAQQQAMMEAAAAKGTQSA